MKRGHKPPNPFRVGPRMQPYKLIIASIVVISAAFLAVVLSDFSSSEGSCGQDATWTFESGTLTISGSGRMYDYSGTEHAPYSSLTDPIDKIVIGEGITYIGRFAFAGTSVKELIISDTVESIGTDAFKGCTELQKVTIGRSLTDFDRTVFDDSPNLYKITLSSEHPYLYVHSNMIFLKRNDNLYLLPRGITSVDIPSTASASMVSPGENGTFFKCWKLKSFTVSSGNPYYTASGGILYNKDMTKVVSVPRAKIGTYTIPDSVTTTQGCLIGSSFDTIILGSGMQNITGGRLALASATTPNPYLHTLDLKSSVKTVEGSSSYDGRFTILKWCTAMECILATGNTYLSADGHSLCSGAGMLLYYIPTDVHAVVPGGTKTIGSCAFRDCLQMTDVTLPDSVTSLEDKAFSNCPMLSSITYGSGFNCAMKSIMFPDCGALSSFYTENNTTYVTRTDGAVYRMSGLSATLSYVPPSLTEFTVPDDVVSVDSTAFSQNENIQTVILGSSVASIADSQFSECTSLDSVTINSPIVSIGSGAFYRTAIISLTIPSSVTSVGSSAFANCGQLESVVFECTDITIGASAFRDCTSLVSMILPDGLVSVENYTFSGCTSLVSVTIPDTVTNIGIQSFSTCRSLGAITLPASLEILGINAFEYCSSVSSIEFSGTSLTSIPERAFISCGCESGTPIVLTLPENLVSIDGNAFSGANVGALTICSTLLTIGDYSFSNCKIEGDLDLSGVETIGKNAFGGNMMTSLSFSEGLLSIGQSAFTHCINLASLQLPSTVTSVGAGAFSECSSLTEVEIDAPNLEMGSTVFSRCQSLESVSINAKKEDGYMFYMDSSLRDVTLSGFTKLGKYEFYYCSSLETLTIPVSLTSIGENSFVRCTSLQSVNVPSGNTYFRSDGRSLLFSGSTELVVYYRGNTSSEYTIPDTVKILWDESFTDSPNLTRIVCGAALRSSDVSREMFRGCARLSYVDVSDYNKEMRSLDGIVYSKDRTILLYAPPAVHKCSMDPSTEIIKSRAFYECKDLVSVKFSAHLTDIGDSAFYGCTGLTSINLASVSSIGAKAFYGCSSISKIVISESGKISFGNDCMDLGRESVIVGSTFEDGFLDKYLGGTKANYVSLDMDTRSEVEKVRDNTPLIAGGVIAAAAGLVVIEMIMRRRR